MKKERTNKKIKARSNSKKKNRVITSSVLKITTLFVFVAVIAILYQNSMTNNIVADNNRQRAQEKLGTVKGSKLKIGDYVNYDHTLQVDPNTKDTISVPKEKLKYTSNKGDLNNNGNGKETQTVDVSGYNTKWRVYDIQGDQVLLMPETQPTAEIKGKSALAFLWYEKEMYNIAGLYGHGYGADETKKFNYEVGSRIPSEKDTRTETKTGTGARPMLLKDIEDAYSITTNEQRQKLSDYSGNKDYPVGSNKLTDSIYYPTLNKTNARDKEEKIDSYATGDIGVSKTKKKLTDIKNEYYYINKLDKVHTKTYDASTGKDIQKEIIHKYWNILGSCSIGVKSNYFTGYEVAVFFSCGDVSTDNFYSANSSFGYGNSTSFKDTTYFGNLNGISLRPRPVVFLSSANNYYKEQGSGEYATYSLIKEESEESQHPKIQNPYNVSLNNVSLKGTYADRLLFESKLDAPVQDVAHTNLTRADGTKVIDNITYTVEGLPEGITYDVIKKQVGRKEEVTVQIFPEELSVAANINKNDIYDGAKFSYDILLNKNGTNLSTKQLDETADGKVEIAKYTEKKDIIDEEGNAVNYVLDITNFNDTVRKDNTYYTNTITKDANTNSNEIVYNLNIVYDKLRYDIEQINLSLDNIEKDKNTLETNNTTKKGEITGLDNKVKEAEQTGKVTETEKQGLLNDLNVLETKQKAEKAEITNILNALNKIEIDNKDTIEKDTKTKTRVTELTNKLNELKESIANDDTTISDLRTRIEGLKVIDPAKEKAKEELNTLKEEVDKTIPEENTEADNIKKKLDEINTEVEKEAKDGVIKKEDKEAIQTKLDNVQKEIDAEKEKVKELQGKLDKIKEDNKGVIEDEEVAGKVKEIQDKITKENDKITNNETYKGQIEDKLNKIQVIDIEKLTGDLSAIEAKVNALKTKDDAKKTDITNLDTKVKEAEKAGKVTEDVKQGLIDKLAVIEGKQKTEKEELANIEKELKTFKETNAKALEADSNLKAKEEALTTKLNNLKESITSDDKTIADLRTRIEALEVIDPAKEKAKDELNILKEEVDTKIPEENTDADNIKKKLDEINSEVENEAEDGVIKKEDKEAIQTKLDDVQKEIDAEKEKVKELQDKLDKIKEDNSGVIEDEEVAGIVKEIQDKIDKENNKITNNEKYKEEVQKKLDDIEVIDTKKLTADLEDIEKRTNTLEENDNTKKDDITKLEEEVKTAETNGGTDVLGKKKLEEGIADIKKRQEDEKTERDNLEKELNDLIANNNQALENETELKEKADTLKEKINNLKDTIEEDDAKIKELEDRIAKIKVLDVKDIEALQKKVSDLEDKNKKANEDIEENKKTIANLNDLIEKLKKENSEAIDKITKEKEDLEDKNKKLEDENKKLKDKIIELEAEIEQLKNLEQDNKKLNDRIAELEEKVLEAEAKANDLKDKLDKCSKHGKDLEEQIKELEKTIKEQDEKIKKLEQEKEDLEKRNKELEEKNKLNEEELKEKGLLEKKIKELEEKVKTLEAEKEKLAKYAMDKKEQEQKDKEKEADAKEDGKVSDANSNNKPSVRDNAVASNSKKNNSKNTSNNKIPHAGAGSVIILTIITALAIVYTKKVMKK